MYIDIKCVLVNKVAYVCNLNRPIKLLITPLIKLLIMTLFKMANYEL